ncbi:maleylpyruvate isomerase family mycothiol-dependent enzyme [Streptomyces armeniacus]|uniref:Maleylpyruvate isomerase family mycothiol-dependent enzyme n=1 Tax=Streptomyces armeniacus TaxID=83291 RepID=A0A345XMW4_9ACTN|nr:maleylpyruvate isomerase family mycothiol-dependent enzyme [Streptomyces armeniacus]AXK32980.1 maleylpyruvate isomerase family mycothiol-dependent enzyme [Streptomyces armeniacus]
MTSPAHDNPAAESPAADATAVRDATERLLAAVDALDDAAVRAPSHLPGWTRGHVLAHLARNADALINVLSGRPMYVSGESRDADIERDAPHTAAEHLEDLRASAARLDAAFADEAGESWQRTVELRNGVTDLAASVPFRRWIEVELHHVDLGVGYAIDDLPAGFVDRETANMARRFDGHPDLTEAVELRAEDGRSWRTGARTGEPVVVVGTPAALTGWLTGRTTGSGLSASAPLPSLPPL